jgi:hypothetical protein
LGRGDNGETPSPTRPQPRPVSVDAGVSRETDGDVLIDRVLDHVVRNVRSPADNRVMAPDPNEAGSAIPRIAILLFIDMKRDRPAEQARSRVGIA